MKRCIDEIERERKYLLDAREYFALKKAYAKKSDVILQKNYYYDTKDFEFGKRGITCRIREKDGKFVATVKTHSGRGDGISYEHSCAVSDEYDGSFFDARTSLWGVLVTERIILFADRFVEVVLDRNSYLGTVDYELEIEAAPEGEVRAEKLAGEIYAFLCAADKDGRRCCGMSHVNTVSKSERFFERLKKLMLMNDY